MLSIAVLGGDHTNRAVVREWRRLWSRIPIAGLSTGTSNAFPVMHEPTITGIAAGLHASNKLDPTIALAPSKLIEVEDSERGDGAGVRDIAIGDAMVSTDRCVGARAIWTADPIRQAFLADVWGIQRTHIVGHSLGGAIAAQFSLDHPNHVASVTVVNPAGFGDEIAETRINGIVQAQGRRVLKAALEMLRADASLASRQMVDDVLKYLRLDGVQSRVGELAAGVFPNGQQAATPGRHLNATPVPTSVYSGAQDRTVPSPHAAHAPSGASVHVWSDTGHVVMMEKAGEV